VQDDPLWYKDALIYELHVRAFYDSDGDGIGDFKGLTQKLDYLQDLGITAIWLLPFYPSPLKDDGYDIADYTEINPSYGTLADFKEFLDAAHARGLRHYRAGHQPHPDPAVSPNGRIPRWPDSSPR
jgi:maltose alpha-D-glucosyltransferase / alpha-amylase